MAEQQFFIKPAREGLIVRDPATREPLAAAGDWKPRSKYWLSRAAEKSVIETELPAQPAPKKSVAGKTAAPGGDQ